MRSRPSMKRAAPFLPWKLTLTWALILPWILPAPSTVIFAAGRPADDASAAACLRLESRSAAPGTAGCMRFVDLKNSCDLDVVAEVARTQHLFSGTLRQAFSVVIPAGGEQSLTCAWWSGATAPLEHELLGARFLAAPIRPEPRDHCGGL